MLTKSYLFPCRRPHQLVSPERQFCDKQNIGQILCQFFAICEPRTFCNCFFWTKFLSIDNTQILLASGSISVELSLAMITGSSINDEVRNSYAEIIVFLRINAAASGIFQL